MRSIINNALVNFVRQGPDVLGMTTFQNISQRVDKFRGMDGTRGVAGVAEDKLHGSRKRERGRDIQQLLFGQ